MPDLPTAPAAAGMRRIEVRRGGRLVDTLDLYDYLLRADGSHDPRLQSGDVVFVPVHGARVRLFGERLGPILVQFPPTRTRDDGLLRLYLDSLDPELRYAFEFRHESWADADLGPHARVGSLEGRYHPGLNLDVRPLFSESQAEDRARSVVQPGSAQPGDARP